MVESDSIDSATIVPILQVETSFYLRLTVNDKPGVLSSLTAALSDQGINVEAMHQSEPVNACADVVLLTSAVSEQKLQRAIATMTTYSDVQSDIKVIRVEALR